MARVAGDNSHYKLAVIDAGGQAKGPVVELPSVTTVLKALPKGGLEWWGYKMGLLEGRKLGQQMAQAPTFADDDAFYEEAKKLGRAGQVVTPSNALKLAGGRGSDVHDLAEALLRDGKLPATIDPERQGYADGLQKFYDERIKGKCKVLLIEMPVFSLTYQYAGTLDALVLDDSGAYVVLDFKTSKGIYDSHLLQITAYEHACVERGLIPANAAHFGTVVRIGADGTYEMKMSSCEIADFMAVYRVWQFLEAMSK